MGAVQKGGTGECLGGFGCLGPLLFGTAWGLALVRFLPEDLLLDFGVITSVHCKPTTRGFVRITKPN